MTKAPGTSSKKFQIKPLFLVLGLIILLEFGLRFAVHIFPAFKAWAGISSYKCSTLNLIASPPVSVGIRKDTRGFRNSEIPVQADIVVLGDDIVFGNGVEASSAFPQALSQMMNQTGYNMGVPQSGPMDYYLLIDQALELKPKRLIFAIDLQNDFFEAYSTVYSDAQFKDWRSADTVRIEAIQSLQNKEPFLEQSLPSSPGKISPPKNTLVLVQVIQKIIAPGQNHLQSGMSAEEIAQLRQEYKKIDREDARIAEGLGLTLAMAAKAADKARAQNAEPLIVLVPSKFSFLRAEDIPSDLAAAHSRAVEQEGFVREKLRDFLKASRIPFIDLYLPFTDAAQENKVLIDKRGNWSPEAHQLIAAESASWINEEAFRNLHEKASASARRAGKYRERAGGIERKVFFGFILLLAVLTLFLTKLRDKGRPILFVVFYGFIVLYQMWNPTDFFPFSSTLFMNTPRQKAVTYRKLTAVLQNGGSLNMPLSEILPALGGNRTSFLVRKAINKPAMADSLATAIALAYDKKLGSMESPRIREVRFEEWKWDFEKDPFDPDKGFVLKRVIGKPAQETPHA